MDVKVNIKGGLIRRDELLKELYDLAMQRADGKAKVSGIISFVECMPADADANAARHGRWENLDGDYKTAQCSACGECEDVTDEEFAERFWPLFRDVYKYCPSCGARMDLPEAGGGEVQ